MNATTSVAEDDDYMWRVTNRQGKVTVALGPEASKLPANPVMHRIGELLIKLGIQLIQSHVVDDDEGGWQS